jgi:peptidyl-prolyl cis-trans isomerase SurA
MKFRSCVGIFVLVAASPALARVASAQMPAQVSTPTSTSPKSSSLVSQPQPVGRPVARVNGAVLTDQDLLREMLTIFPYARQHNGGFPKEMEANIRDGAMKMMIFEELVYQEALRRDMTVSPSKLRAAEDDFRGQFATPSSYEEYVKTECKGSQQVLHEKVRRSLLIDALLKIEVGQKSTVSEAELKDYYDKNPARFEFPESFAFQTISVLPPQNATPEQLKEGRKRAEDALRQAKATKTYEEFGMLAEKMSDDDYRVMMGDHKSVNRAKLAPAVVQALLSIQPGQITGIIQLEQAYTIVRLNSHIFAGKTTFAEVEAQLRKELEGKKTNQLRASLDKALRSKSKVEVL